MKKLALLLMLCTLPCQAELVGSMNKSSFTQTNESAYIAAKTLDKIVIGVTSSGGILRLYNSTWTTASPISSTTLTIGTYDYGDLKVSGIFYVLVGNSNGVTILYK